jgi:hypothetical protein
MCLLFQGGAVVLRMFLEFRGYFSRGLQSSGYISGVSRMCSLFRGCFWCSGGYFRGGFWSFRCISGVSSMFLEFSGYFRAEFWSSRSTSGEISGVPGVFPVFQGCVHCSRKISGDPGVFPVFRGCVHCSGKVSSVPRILPGKFPEYFWDSWDVSDVSRMFLEFRGYFRASFRCFGIFCGVPAQEFL